MTDRLYSLTVVLDKEYRDDDAEAILDAIRMIKGVAEVSGNVAEPAFYAAHAQARLELRKQLIDVLYPGSKRG